MLSFLLSLTFLVTLSNAEDQVSLETVDVAANGLTFTCDELKSSSSEGSARNIMLLHGFPNSRLWFKPLLEEWQLTMEAENIHALACDLRGYSDGAKPMDIASYEDMEELFVEDVFALATATFGSNSNFHLVGHDHGAVLGWLVAKEGQANGRIMSFTAMSVPHNDLFSSALCGPDEDPVQAIVSNYFNQWTDAGAATETMFDNVGAIFGFSSREDMRLAMLWYYAARRHVAVPRVISDEEVPEAAVILKLVREGLPLEPRPCIAQEKQVGQLDLPVMFVCGALDPFILCTDERYQSPSSSLLPNYRYAEAAECGHDFLTPADCNGNSTQVAGVMQEITEFIALNDEEKSDGCFLNFIPFLGDFLCMIWAWISGFLTSLF